MVELTEANWPAEVVRSDLPVLVQFHAPWSGPCRLLRPILDRLECNFAGKFKFGRLDIDDFPQLAAFYGISHQPPQVLLFRRDRLLERAVGLCSENDLALLIYRVLEA
jgi:thioredoxin 1